MDKSLWKSLTVWSAIGWGAVALLEQLTVLSPELAIIW